MTEQQENWVFIDDDAGEDAIFDDGAVTTTIVHEKTPSKFAEQASSAWSRAKAGFEKGKDHEQVNRGDDAVIVEGAAVEGEPVAVKESKRVGAWERLATIPATVAGVVGYRTTGSPRPTAALLVTESVVEVPKPRPIPDLFHDATEEVAGLVHAEMALVKTELKQKAKLIGPGIGLLLAAVAMLLFALPFVLWAAVFALALVVPLWAAALIIFAVLLLITALLAFAGLKKLKKLGGVHSLAGGSIKESIHAIVEAFKGHKWADAQAAIKEQRL